MSQGEYPKKKKKTTNKYIEHIENSSCESVNPTYNSILPNLEVYDINV
ncbi:44237_t:CDS:1 [Gigaspora margarita]|uniref:44237_t:CDS:1 n=1 Tax=Gigaspora margarita TaxID=4874 RepID=A0ABN7W1P8_GIGMA|nr:44237_t:CDS:1 [Gigaspora margarita]